MFKYIVCLFLLSSVNLGDSSCPVDIYQASADDCINHSNSTHHCCYYYSINDKDKTNGFCNLMLTSDYTDKSKQFVYNNERYFAQCTRDPFYCGVRDPSKSSECKSRNSVDNSCCYFVDKNKTGCFWLGRNQTLKISQSKVYISCSLITYLKQGIITISVLFLFILF